MHAEITHLAKLFKGVSDLREVMKLYCLAPNMSVTSIDDLTTAFEQMYAVKIKVGLIPDLGGKLLRGMYIREDDQVVVALDESLPPFWRRYIAVKEMCSLILSDKDYVTQDPVALLEALIFEDTAPKDGDAPLDLVSDSWAKLAAHEFLFPFEDREHARAKIADEPNELFLLSKIYQVPQHVIEWALSDTYHEMCRVAWGSIQTA
jgi:hypothetical protein